MISTGRPSGIMLIINAGGAMRVFKVIMWVYVGILCIAHDQVCISIAVFAYVVILIIE